MRRTLALVMVGGLLMGAAGYWAGSSHALTPSQIAAADTCQTFPETGQTVCGDFLAYWQQHGGLAQQGYPISPTFQEKSETDGQTHTVQYFERAVFEAHPENGPPNNVLLSLLGAQKYKAKYPNGAPGAVALATVAVPTPTVSAASGATFPTIFFSVTSPVAQGGVAQAKLRTSAGAACTITVSYKSGPGSADGLGPQTADSGGVAIWTWKVGTDTTPGVVPISATCSLNGATGAATSMFIVT